MKLQEPLSVLQWVQEAAVPMEIHNPINPQRPSMGSSAGSVDNKP